MESVNRAVGSGQIEKEDFVVYCEQSYSVVSVPDQELVSYKVFNTQWILAWFSGVEFSSGCVSIYVFSTFVRVTNCALEDCDEFVCTGFMDGLDWLFVVGGSAVLDLDVESKALD